MFISCQISDGLGNRLFQIAAMLGYAEKHGHTPVFIREWIKDNPAQPGGNKVCSLFPGIQTMTLGDVGGEWVVLKPPFEAAMTYVELPFVGGHVKLDGYFQSAQYFPSRLPVLAGIEVAVLEGPAVFLHVRRGDYLHLFNAHHRVELDNYYQQALDMFPTDSFVYVCSDDIGWCKATLPGRYRSVGFDRWRWVGGDEFETLSVMIGCTLGGICANSTFSWWGAWLGWNSEKLMIMPSLWMHVSPGRPVAKDLYPVWALKL